MRDNQRSRVYKSDSALDDLSDRYDDIGDLRRFVKKVWSQKRVQDLLLPYRRYDVLVKDGRGRSRACGGRSSISMPIWSRRTGVILHELAHTITSRQLLGEPHAAHGWEFCANYLKLVLYVMGREAHDALKAAFKKHRVRFTPPRKHKPLSPEQRAALVARLTEARLKKAA